MLFLEAAARGLRPCFLEHPTEKIIETAKELGVEPVWGSRNAILYEIGTYATFATRTLTNRLGARICQCSQKLYDESSDACC